MSFRWCAPHVNKIMGKKSIICQFSVFKHLNWGHTTCLPICSSSAHFELLHTYTTYMCTIVHTYVELTSYDANSIACTRCAGVKYLLKLNVSFLSSSFALTRYLWNIHKTISRNFLDNFLVKTRRTNEK